MATNLKNAIIQWCVEHKIPSKIKKGGELQITTIVVIFASK